MAIKIVELKNGVLNPADADAVIAITEGLEAASVIELAHLHGLRHVVQRDGLEFRTELEVAKKMSRDPQLFLKSPLEVIFGLSLVGARKSFFSQCPAETKKNEILSGFELFLDQIRGMSTIKNQALLVTDELFTNASKNCWDPGLNPFRDPPSRTGVIEFFGQADAKRLVFGCRDSFGALNIREIIDRIRSCYEKGIAESIRFDTPGAGIGTVIVFDACVSYYAGVEKNRSTVVCVAMPLGKNRRTTIGFSKNLHLVEKI